MSNNKPRQIFIGNLSYGADEQMVRDAFATTDVHIGEVRIIREPQSGRSRGFAFVDLTNDEGSTIAEVVRRVDGLQINGRACRVAEVMPRERKPGERERTPRGRRVNSSVWDD